MLSTIESEGKTKLKSALNAFGKDLVSLSEWNRRIKESENRGEWSWETNRVELKKETLKTDEFAEKYKPKYATKENNQAENCTSQEIDQRNCAWRYAVYGQ